MEPLFTILHTKAHKLEKLKICHMKKTTSLSLIIFFAFNGLFAQNNKVKIFNTTFKVKDVIGTTNLSTQKYVLELKEVLVKNEDYYLKTIGSYRDDFNSDDPNSLFNLIDKGVYPLLDEINMRYYEEVVIPNLKSKPTIKGRSDFISFCGEWDGLTDFNKRKALLFKNEFIEIGKIIQQERFTTTKAPFKLKEEVTQKLSATITADIKANLKANNIDASAALVNYLSRTVNEQTEYSGTMLVVEFEDGYMTRIKNALNGLSREKIGKDDFSIGLKDYAAPGSIRTATTGLVAFKLDGKINKSKLTEENLKADIKAKFKTLGDAQIADIAASVSIGFVSKIEKTFSAEIDNIYIKSLLTSKKIDDIETKKDEIYNLINSLR